MSITSSILHKNSRIFRPSNWKLVSGGTLNEGSNFALPMPKEGVYMA